MSNLYCPPEHIKCIAVLGTGSVGASWIALFLAHGYRIQAYDPAPDAEQKTHDFVINAWPALLELDIAKVPVPPIECIRFFDSAVDAVRDADVIQENTPEKPEVKNPILETVSAVSGPEIPIISSTGGIPPSQLQSVCRHPERVVVIHPFNPTHLMPLVEVVGGAQTSDAVIEWAMALATWLGKQPVRLNHEASGHMTNRLQFALVREAVACLLDGTASAQDIDNAIRYGLGTRWAVMGSFMSIHLAGGNGGARSILSHAASAIEDWWTPKPQPRLTPDVIERLAQAGEEVTRGQPISDWIQWRDEQLLDVLKLQRSSAAQEPASPTPPRST